METWLRERGLGVLHVKSYSLPASEIKALQKDARLHKVLDKLWEQSSRSGTMLPESQSLLHDPGLFFERPIAAAPMTRASGAAGSVKASNPSQKARSKPEPAKAPATPHPKARAAPSTPLKRMGARRRYTRKAPPR